MEQLVHLLNPEQREKSLGAFLTAKIKSTSETIYDSLADEEKARKAMSKGAKDFAAIAELAGDIGRRMGSDKGASFAKLAKGSAMMGMALAVAPADFGITAGVTFVMGLMQTGDGLGGILGCSDKDDDAENPILKQLEQISSILVKISQQIVQLGQYVKQRFDQLGVLIGDNHTESMQFLRSILFNDKLSVADLKVLMQACHGDLSKDLMALQTDVHALLEHQRNDAQTRMANHDALLAELIFLQTQDYRRLVNEVKASLSRPEELKQQFETYSRQLSSSIKEECRGSQALTGADLPVDCTNLTPEKREKLRARWLLALEDIDAKLMESRLRKLAACNVDALVGFATKQKTVTGPVNELPNLVLLKDRVKAFIDLHQAYAQQAPAISSSAKAHVGDVIEMLNKTRTAIRAIDPKRALEAGMTAFESQYLMIRDAIKAAQLDFEQKLMKKWIANRHMRLENLVNLLQGLPVPQQVAIPEENQTFSYQLNYKIAWHSAHIQTGWVPHFTDVPGGGYFAIDSNLSPLAGIQAHNFGHGSEENMFYFTRDEAYKHAPNDPASWGHYTHNKMFNGPAEMGSFSLLWGAFDKGSRDLLQHKLVHYNYWKPSDPNAAGHIDGTCQTVGLSEKVEHKKLVEKNLARMVEQTQAINTAMTIVSDPSKNPEHFALFKRDYLDLVNNPLLKSMMTLGPRAVCAKPGQSIDLVLYLNGSNLDRCIPQSALFAEHCGLGEIKLFYTAELLTRAQCPASDTPVSDDTKRLVMSLDITFYPTDKSIKPINFYFNRYKLDVASVYTELDEPIYRWWYGDLLFDDARVNLSSALLVHTNPFFKRGTNLILSNSWQMSASSSPQATKAMDALVETYLVALRSQFNQQVQEAIQNYQGPIGEALLQSEAMLTMTRCLAILSVSAQASVINTLLDNIPYQNRQQLLAYLKAFDPHFNASEMVCKTYLAEAVDAYVTTPFMTTKKAVLREVQKAVVLGDTDLHYLSHELEQYFKAVSINPISSLPSASNLPVVEELFDATDDSSGDESECAEDRLERITHHFFNDRGEGTPGEPPRWQKPTAVSMNKPGYRVLKGHFFASKDDRRSYMKVLNEQGYTAASLKNGAEKDILVTLPLMKVVPNSFSN